ncbi:MAG: stage VI sporulation protein F [Turicibacter sp.]|nr:stage VI sporulation protein F [Turicibacter sp.]MDO5792700.1 stage VI sporulation protein F [Turicibacter sp.]
MFDNLFGRFGKDVNVNQEELFNIADQASEMDLKNEDQVRALIQSVGAMVGRKVDKSVEDQLTKMIINGEVPTDMDQLLKMMM